MPSFFPAANAAPGGTGDPHQAPEKAMEEFTNAITTAVEKLTPPSNTHTHTPPCACSGLVNDACMKDITEQAAAGAFDSVVHAGDWA